MVRVYVWPKNIKWQFSSVQIGKSEISKIHFKVEPQHFCLKGNWNRETSTIEEVLALEEGRRTGDKDFLGKGIDWSLAWESGICEGSINYESMSEEHKIS